MLRKPRVLIIGGGIGGLTGALALERQQLDVIVCEQSPQLSEVGAGIGLAPNCQSAFKFDPRSASNFDPLWRRVLTVALAPSELVGVAETARARVVG